MSMMSKVKNRSECTFRRNCCIQYQKCNIVLFILRFSIWTMVLACYYLIGFGYEIPYICANEALKSCLEDSSYGEDDILPL